MAETQEFISYELVDDGRIARIWLNRADAHNAQHRTLLVQLDEAFQRAEADDEVRVIILAARGANFSAGHDMGSEGLMAELMPGPGSIRRICATAAVGRGPSGCTCRSGTTSSKTPDAGATCARSPSCLCRATRSRPR
jgi:Enoyl-CoA hydratase/isomerase